MIIGDKKEFNFKLEKKEINAIEDNALFCGSFSAYFSTYNNKNYRPDRMMKGCFDKEIARFAAGEKLPRLLAQHWSGDIAGVVDEITDDDFGAIVKGRFTNTSIGRDVYINFKTGAIDELSFAFFVTKSEIIEENNEQVRLVLEVSGIDEVSLVTWGMDPNTKPIEINNKGLTIRHAEQALKNSGFSNKQSKTILANGFNSLDRDDSDSQRDAELNEALKVGFKNLLENI